jgi:hypothetical protein
MKRSELSMATIKNVRSVNRQTNRGDAASVSATNNMETDQ